jgi:hypothetical protein
MTVSFISSAGAEATTLTLPSHQAGDLIVMLAMRYSSVSGGTIPTDWNYRYLSQRNGSFVAITCGVFCRIAASSAETSGTWTNWTHLLACVYRDDVDYLFLGSPVYNRGTGTSVSYSAKTASANSNSAGALGGAMAVATGWVIGLGATHLNASGIDTPPSGMTHRGMTTGATNGRIAVADTNAAVASYAGGSTTIASSADWWTNTVEIIDTGTPKTAASGGLFIGSGMSGGMRG